MIQLTPQAEALIKQKVASGLYRDAEEALSVAVRLLDNRDRQVLELRNSIAEGVAAIDRGEGEELTSELMDQIEREAEAACAAGEIPHPDACP